MQIVTVLDLPLSILSHLRVVSREEVRQVGIVLVKTIARVKRLQDKTRLNFHEMLADGLMRFGEYREALLIVDERRSGELDSVELLAEEAINDLTVG